MNEQQQQALAALDTLLETVDVLIPALARQDEEKGHEAVTILLTQAMQIYGTEHPVFQQFFPIMDTIERRISSHDLEGAHRQAALFRTQLVEIKDIIVQSS